MGRGAKVATSVCPAARRLVLRTKVVLPDTNWVVRGGLKAETLHRPTASETMRVCRVRVFTHCFTHAVTHAASLFHGLQEAA